jgi:IS30 family transposase
LTANITLRRLVQRKLNRCWSPDEVCGWLQKTYPDDLSMRLCPETIYRELLLRDNTTLHNRYCLKLRTGRRDPQVAVAHPDRARPHDRQQDHNRPTPSLDRNQARGRPLGR